MSPVAVQVVEIGALVRFSVPGTRRPDASERVIPAVVIGQWPDGSLQLYALHFEGAYLVNSISLESVEMVLSRTELDLIQEGLGRRLTELENQVAALTEEISSLGGEPAAAGPRRNAQGRFLPSSDDTH